MRRINWGVLGTADIARGATIPGMQLAENCNLYAVAGRTLEKAERFRTEFGFEKAYGSYDELLSDPAVEAVYIPLPNSLHAHWATRAMRAGKHVLCEKPLAASEEEARALFETAKQCGVYLMEAFAYLHSPLTAAIKGEIDAGTIGEVRYVENAFVTSGYDKSNIRMHRELLGGGFYDLGCYCVSQALWLLGEPDGVMALGEFNEDGVDTLATGVLAYKNGARAVFNCGMMLAPTVGKRWDRLVIFGTKGVLRTDAEYNQRGRLSYQITSGDTTVTRYVDTPHNYALEVEQLGRCVAGVETPWVSAGFSVMNARTMDRVLKAIGYTREERA